MLKRISSIFLTLFTIVSTQAVTIVENTPKPVKAEATNSVATGFASAIGLGLMIGLVVGGFILIVYLVVRKIQENKRKHSDLLFGLFNIQLEKCNQNKDSKLKFRNWKLAFLTFKRADVYLETSNKNIKFYGNYDGELIIKTEFLLISLYKKRGLFSRERDIIIVPFWLRHLVRKELINDKWAVIINAESIDEALNSDYYSQLVIVNPKDDNKLIDYSDYLQTNFMDKYVHRQIIKDLSLDYKDSIEKVVEMNPNIQTERQNPKD